MMGALPLLLGLSLLGDSYLGAPIVTGAKPLSEPGRYESPRTYDDTLSFYEYYFRREGGVRWRSIVNLPHIRGKHIQSTRPKTPWQGINVYEKGGKVRVFVVPRSAKGEGSPSS